MCTSNGVVTPRRRFLRSKSVHPNKLLYSVTTLSRNLNQRRMTTTKFLLIQLIQLIQLKLIQLIHLHSNSQQYHHHQKRLLHPPIVLSYEEDLTVISDEDESNDRGYCAGITPTVMQDDVFNLFPFQLLPDLKVVVFSDHAIHHIECKKRNYVLPEGSDVTNSLCSELLNLAPVQNIIQRSTLKFDDMKDYNNKYFNHKQLSDKSNHYHSELNRSRLEVMRLRSRINKVGETVSMHQRFLLQIANNNVPRLTQLVSVTLRNNRGISYILGKVVDAIKGVYRARPSTYITGSRIWRSISARYSPQGQRFAECINWLSHA